MHGFSRQWLLALPLALLLSACNSAPKCVGDDEYRQSVERPRLDLPANVRASERMAPLVIPPVAPDPEMLDPAPNCLDEPPPYFAVGRRAESVPAPPTTGGN